MKAGGFAENLKKLKSALVGAPAEKSAPDGKSPKQKKRAVAGLLTWPVENGTVCELISWRSPVKNTRLLIAYAPGTDPHDPLALLNVLVADNRNFLPGMKLQAQKVDERTYNLVGPCPPRRGRWR